MNHLIRFNESLQELEELKKIIDDYFAELTDESLAEIYIDEPEKKVSLSAIVEPDIIDSTSDYDYFIK